MYSSNFSSSHSLRLVFGSIPVLISVLLEMTDSSSQFSSHLSQRKRRFSESKDSVVGAVAKVRPKHNVNWTGMGNCCYEGVDAASESNGGGIHFDGNLLLFRTKAMIFLNLRFSGIRADHFFGILLLHFHKSTMMWLYFGVDSLCAWLSSCNVPHTPLQKLIASLLHPPPQAGCDGAISRAWRSLHQDRDGRGAGGDPGHQPSGALPAR